MGILEDFQKIKRACDEMDGRTIRVGLLDASDIAVWNHDGTSRGIPPREFEVQAAAEQEGEIIDALADNVKAALQGGSGTAALNDTGRQCADLMKKFIKADSVQPPNKHRTNATLYKTGANIVGPITYEVV